MRTQAEPLLTWTAFVQMQTQVSHHQAVLQVHTVGVGVAIGQSCMLLSAGTKGKRFMLPHATGISLLSAVAVKYSTSVLAAGNLLTA